MKESLYLYTASEYAYRGHHSAVHTKSPIPLAVPLNEWIGKVGGKFFGPDFERLKFVERRSN
jgi:hypothetical protein